MQFEYQVIVLDTDEHLENHLNNLGGDGWELIKVLESSFKPTYIFKRQKEES